MYDSRIYMKWNLYEMFRMGKYRVTENGLVLVFRGGEGTRNESNGYRVCF